MLLEVCQQMTLMKNVVHEPCNITIKPIKLGLPTYKLSGNEQLVRQKIGMPTFSEGSQ